MTVIMLGIFVSMVGISFGYPPAARFQVLVVGIPAIALCLLQLGLDFRKHLRSEAAHEGPDVTQVPHTAEGIPTFTSSSPIAAGNYSPETTRKEIVLWIYFLCLTAGILLFGFYVAVPVFLFTFLLFYSRIGLRRAFIYMGVACVLLYVLFEYVFRVPLHTGFVTDYLMDLISG
jgi:hypothetical protein